MAYTVDEVKEILNAEYVAGELNAYIKGKHIRVTKMSEKGLVEITEDALNAIDRIKNPEKYADEELNEDPAVNNINVPKKKRKAADAAAEPAAGDNLNLNLDS